MTAMLPPATPLAYVISDGLQHITVLRDAVIAFEKAGKIHASDARYLAEAIATVRIGLCNIAGLASTVPAYTYCHECGATHMGPCRREIGDMAL